MKSEREKEKGGRERGSRKGLGTMWYGISERKEGQGQGEEEVREY